MNFGEQEIRSLNALSAVSQVEAKDCLIGEKTISFVVNEGQMGRAIGKNGVHIKKLEETFNKRIEIVEFRSAPDAFLAGAFPQIRFGNFEIQQNGENKKVLIARPDTENRRKLLAATGKFRRMREFLSRLFDIVEVKI
ncbi:MAG: NusA-like transcription termination signal-binding factor [Candidatus Diapherotrites archaeon]|nr:NusA-like transcription termination signal-binding factor [Candidatus Diapherotrites archaeon]